MSPATPVLVVLALLTSPAAFGATIQVDTTNDAMDQLGDCSIREAIVAANTNVAVDGCGAGDAAATAIDQIMIPAGTYTLSITGSDETWQADAGVDPYIVVDQPDTTIGDLDVLESAHIVGAGSTTTVLQWAAQEDRLFQVAAVGTDDVVAEFTGLTITGGHVSTEVVNPQAPADEQWSFRRLGGGLAVGAGGSMKLAGTTGSDEGNSGPPDVHESSGEASLSLVDVVIDGNSSEGDGGGLFSGGDLTAQSVVISDNTCGGNGGGVYHEGQLDMTDVALLENTAEGGGAMFMTGGTTGTLLRALVRGNYAVGGGGLSARSLVVVDVVDSTIAENEAFDVGGGMYTNGSFRLSGCTVAGNTSGSDASFGGGGLNTFGGGEYKLENSILADNTAGLADANCGCTGGSCQVSDYFTSDGYNLEDTDSCNLDDTTDRTDTDPMLADLDDYGGPFPTYALLVGSPAIDGGASSCSSVDIRGVARPTDGDGDGTAACDIGSFELDPAEVDRDGDTFCEGLDIGGEDFCADGTTPGDCDDAESAVNPDALEICNDGVDDDCNDLADDDDPDVDVSTFATFYADGDGDGFGDSAISEAACAAPNGYVEDPNDCDDGDSAVNPDATEIKNDIDDDCDGLVDRDDDDFEGACGCSTGAGGSPFGGLAAVVLALGVMARRRRD